MKLTNENKIPENFRNFIDLSPYDRGDCDYSVSQLIDSNQIEYLKVKHYKDLTEDISDAIFSILGKSVHSILEDGRVDDEIVEMRFFHTFTVNEKEITVSGQVDSLFPLSPCPTDPNFEKLNGWELRDWKVCSGNTFLYNPSGKIEWERQINLYNLLATLSGYKIISQKVVAIIRDWNAGSARRNSNYPQRPVHVVDIPKWEFDEAVDYLHGRIAHHEFGARECSAEERWEKPPKFAIHENLKSGSGYKQRATRLLDSEEEAHDYMLDNGILGVVLKRDSEPVRCVGNYCGVNEFCPQYKEYMKANSIDLVEDDD